jgi:hypothetical protein
MTLKTCVIRELERKTSLRNITPKRRACLMYFGHVERAGEEFFKLVRRHDLEGSVAKRSLQAIQPDSEPRRLNIRRSATHSIRSGPGAGRTLWTRRTNDPGLNPCANAHWRVPQ